MSSNARYERKRVRPQAYELWTRMKQYCGVLRGRPQRCDKYYEGISIAPEWNDFSTFQDWAIKHGYRKGLTLARIDKTKDFTPDNCMIVTKAKANDMRSVVRKTDCGMTIRELIGETRDRRFHGRSSYRYFNSSWDARSSISEIVLSASDAGGISARKTNERNESQMKKIVSAAVAAVISSSAAFAWPENESNESLDRLVQGSGLSAYEAGAGVTNIRASAFHSCAGLRSVVAQDVKTVGRQAFTMCHDLESVRLDGLEDVSQLIGAFAGCRALVNVYLGSIDFTSPGKMHGFPWQAPNLGIIFHFRNGDYDRLGRKID